MTMRLKPAALLVALTASGVLVGGAGLTPSYASISQCKQGQFCVWTSKNFGTSGAFSPTTTLNHKCGQGAFDPARYSRLPRRSVWNRTTRTWYGLDKKNHVRLILRHVGMRDSNYRDIQPYKDIKHWCWK